MGLDDVTRLLDEGVQSLRFSRQLLAASFENLPSGISVVDPELNLVAWNSLYIELFGYPPGLVRVGVPIADLIRFNIERGGFPGPMEEQVERRLARLRAPVLCFERIRRDGRVIKSVGGPMPGGGYLTSFTDVTREAQMRGELEHTLEELESRVAARTRELSEANHRLAESTRDKTCFRRLPATISCNRFMPQGCSLPRSIASRPRPCARWWAGWSVPSAGPRPCCARCSTSRGSMPGASSPIPK
jgi:PAS domain S-box-containing protein